MNNKQKAKAVIDAYESGKLKMLGESAASVPASFFIGGTTPRFAFEVLRKYRKKKGVKVG